MTPRIALGGFVWLPALLFASALFFTVAQSHGISEMALIRPCPHDPDQRYVPAGRFTMGSSREEREYAYQLDQDVTRPYGWYERETRKTAATPAYCIDRYPVTNARYKAFIDKTGRPEPHITAQEYQRQGFLVHPYKKVERFLWKRRQFPSGRADHPVVLVSVADAKAYCDWKGRNSRARHRLPSEEEWEKAARGTNGSIYPWGNRWDPARLNSGERFGGTTPVDRFPDGKSPYGVEDAAGNVFEWTGSLWDQNKYILKGCSWDDLPGTCRAAMRHGRPPKSKHMLIGFRCASDTRGLDLRQDDG